MHVFSNGFPMPRRCHSQRVHASEFAAAQSTIVKRRRITPRPGARDSRVTPRPVKTSTQLAGVGVFGIMMDFMGVTGPDLTNIAYGAHIGGFATGIVMSLLRRG